MANPHLALALLACAACSPSAPPKPPKATTAPTPETTTPKPNETPAPKDKRLGEAFQALGQGDFNTCRSLASKVLKDMPHHPRAEFILGLGLHKAKRYAEAQPLFESAETATHAFAGQEAVPYYLGWCDYWLGDFEAARAAFGRHLKTNQEGDSHFGLGAIALELGDFDAARLELQQALEMFEARVAAGDLQAGGDVAKAHARLADLDLAEDDSQSARTHLESALALDGNRPAVWFKLFNVATDLGDAALASRAKAQYERLSPKADGQTEPMATGANH